MPVILARVSGRHALAEVFQRVCISARMGGASHRLNLSHSARRLEDDSTSDTLPKKDIIVQPLKSDDPYFGVLWNREQPTQGVYRDREDKDFNSRRALYRKELHELRVRYAADVRTEPESQEKSAVVTNKTVDAEETAKLEQEEKEYLDAKAAWIEKLNAVRAEEKAVRHKRSLKSVAAIKKNKLAQCKSIFIEQKAASHSFIVTDDDALLENILSQRLEEEISFNTLSK
eukprot:m.650132 g.650132  ORF g.650132 m.650132 type:complete len:230 (-) comp22670_c1_seq1:314-1003(-)